ncbi:ABC transporter permease subunit [Paludisphaera borealis]|uniref:ABC-2 type transporter domain-containing protein n=1 Tax=Paludisphaera borealis TaxID=1387353 RepID=A0A1U7CSD2_9BACT|nr:ABC transporter permease subunit [Paludisphaera borealis]APW61854.1 hypothetical protein BSF38_03384 [Paludisphaera borealis]
MLPGPIVRREMKAATRGRGWFVVRALLGLLIGACVVAPALGFDPADEDDAYNSGAVHAYAAYVFAVAIGFEILVLGMHAAMSAAVSIAEEREKDTLSLLLLTRLTRLELAVTKLAGRVLPSLLLTLVGLPFLIVGGRWAGLPPLLAIEAFAVLISTVAVAGSFGILASARRDRSTIAIVESSAWTTMWLVGLPVVSRLPVVAGSLWGDLLVEVRRFCSWLAPSSPLSLVTDIGWLTRGPGMADALAGRLHLMAALQLVVIGVILAGVVASLRLREPHPKAWDAFGGYRPPVDDDPIYWREYLLPLRGARRLVIWIYLRQLFILFRAILLMALQAVVIGLLLTAMIGTMIGAGYFGYRAFQEAWWGRAFPSGPYEARDAFNFFIRCVTFFVGLSPAAATAATLAAQIVAERDKKTWDSLLATPLTGPEILGSKMRGITRSLWQAMRWLVPLWLLGVVCDALHPLGFLTAAAGLCAVAALGLALGGAAALKPGATSQTVNSQAALWMVALMGLGAMTILAPLCSAHHVAMLWTWSPWHPRAAIVVIAAVLLTIAASLTIAHWLIRRSFARFDEWVGRPHRKEAAPGAAPSVDDEARPTVPLRARSASE